MTAAERILARALAASPMKSADWGSVQAGLRDRAFFSATVDDARRLAAMREACAKVAAGEMSDSDARAAIRRALEQTGYAPDEGKEGGLQDLSSRRRLDLILKTNADEAHGYVRYCASIDPDALAATPCQELIRLQARKAPRDWETRWREAGGRLYGNRMIALKTDEVWTRISRFGHPWPPFDFGSGMGVAPVGRREAIRYGVISPDDPPPRIDPEKRPGFNDNLREHVPFSEVKHKDKEHGWEPWPWLKRQFGDQIQKRGDFVEWRGNLIRENFQKGGSFRMELGEAGDSLLGKLAARPETAALGKELEARGSLEVTQDWLDRKRRDGSDHRVHFFPMADHPEDTPLTIGDIELIPSIWRAPDRAFNAGGGSICLEIDSIQGDSYRMIVSLFKEDPDTGVLTPRKAPKLSTFYRTGEPYEEKQ